MTTATRRTFSTLGLGSGKGQRRKSSQHKSSCSRRASWGSAGGNSPTVFYGVSWTKHKNRFKKMTSTIWIPWICNLMLIISINCNDFHIFPPVRRVGYSANVTILFPGVLDRLFLGRLRQPQSLGLSELAEHYFACPKCFILWVFSASWQALMPTFEKLTSYINSTKYVHLQVRFSHVPLKPRG